MGFFFLFFCSPHPFILSVSLYGILSLLLGFCTHLVLLLALFFNSLSHSWPRNISRINSIVVYLFICFFPQLSSRSFPFALCFHFIVIIFLFHSDFSNPSTLSISVFLSIRFFCSDHLLASSTFWLSFLFFVSFSTHLSLLLALTLLFKSFSLCSLSRKI